MAKDGLRREFFPCLLMVLWALILPLSTSGITIVSVLSVIFVCWVFSSHSIRTAALQPVIALCIGFYLFQLLAALYSTAPWQDILWALKRSIKLLFLPFLFVCFVSPRTRKAAMIAYLVGMMAVLVAGVLKHHFHFSWGRSAYSSAAVFKDHIQNSALMAFGAFLAACMAPHFPKVKSLFYFIAICMGCFVLFLGNGRSGYVLLTVLALFWGFRTAGLKGAVLTLCALTVLFGVAYLGGSGFQKRVHEVGTDVAQYQQGDAYTSSGQRIGFNLNSLKLIQSHPIFGSGTGSFAAEYRQRYGSQGALATNNPHNQYTLYAVQYGVIGVLWFVLILVAGFLSSFKLPTLEAGILQGIMLMMAVGSLFNSWLSDTTEATMFVFFTAMALASRRGSRA